MNFQRDLRLKNMPGLTARTLRGFTLIELLVSTAILALILVLMVQAIGAVSRTWSSGVARIDNFSKARVILSLIDRDIQSIVLRRDLGAFINAAGSTNACAFYTQIEGYTGDRRLSLVQYALMTNSNSVPTLQRSDYGMDYTNAVLSLQTTNALPDLTKIQTQDVAEGILRFEYQFLASDGTLHSNYYVDYNNANSSSNSKAMVVSVIVLDDAAVRLAQKSGTLAALITKFNGTPSNNQTYAQLWNQTLLSSTFAQGLPKTVGAGVRVFDRQLALP